MNILPKGWLATRLGDLVELKYGESLPARLRVPGPFLVFGSNGPVGTHKAAITDSPAIIVGRKGSIGEVHFSAQPCFPIDTTYYVDTFAACDAAFTFHLLKSLPLRELDRATAIPGLNREDAYNLDVQLPPLAEQRRIVTKIDDLTARSKSARANIVPVLRLVEKYKQAILARAFRGDLTQAWRSTNPAQQSPENRLEVLRMRRGRLSNNQSKQAKLASPGMRIPMHIGPLPSSWAITTLEGVSSPQRLIQYGILKPGPDFQGGVPYVKVMNIRGGKIHLDKIRRTTPEIAHQYRRATIATGDILLTIRGTVGRLAIVPEVLDGGNITQDSVRIAIIKEVDRDFVFWYLHCPAVQQYFVANQKGVAVRGINVGDVRPLEVPFPPKEEQQEIVRRIKNAFRWIDGLSADTSSTRRLLDHLDQAILAKAFAGELISQDSEDVPATEMLKRVKTSSQSTQKKVKASKGRTKALRSKETLKMKSRRDDDVKGRPYLVQILKRMDGRATAEQLFTASNLSEVDFYKQLSDEYDQCWLKVVGPIVEIIP